MGWDGNEDARTSDQSRTHVSAKRDRQEREDELNQQQQQQRKVMCTL